MNETFWLIKNLIWAGASLLTKDDDNSSPLQAMMGFRAIARFSEHEVVSALQSFCSLWKRKGKDVWDDITHGLRAPLYSAIINERSFVAKELLKMGADPNGSGGAGEMRPLEAAVGLKNDELVQLLLEYKADIEFRPVDSKTLFHPVAKVTRRFQDSRILSLLLKRKAITDADLAPEDRATLVSCPDVTYGYRATPLLYAIYMKHHAGAYATKLGVTEEEALRLCGDMILQLSIRTLPSRGSYGIMRAVLCEPCVPGYKRLMGLERLSTGEFSSIYSNYLSRNYMYDLPDLVGGLTPAARWLLAFWKNKNPEKTKEDAMKEIGDEVLYSRENSSVWDNYENLNLDSPEFTPKGDRDASALDSSGSSEGEISEEDD
ncbi:hypothetical protein TWF481_003363 [Arthrobotrys musiformis]|uniref:Ankyrin repeat protein n=1 Tax=Arthrobotrys musiformis TaxID=47236 RepID=A0AAV9VQ65_9PEZI